MAEVEIEEAADALDKLVDRAKAAVATQIDIGLLKAQRLAVTRFMVGGGLKTPVNPPPGPLHIRSGNLRRSLYILKFTWYGDEGWGALTWNDAEIPYGKVHEFGSRNGHTPPRPFARPALDLIVPETRAAVERSLAQVAGSLRLM